MKMIIAAFFAALSLNQAMAGPNTNMSKIAEDAYIYAYPLVLSGITEAVMTNVAMPNAANAPVNQFVHLKTFPDIDIQKDVIRPNVDTLYSVAWVDVSKEPMVLLLPDSNNRYYLMEMLDAWTNVFASPGKRTTGTKASQYAIVGPTWTGSLPVNLKKIGSPTNIVWIIGRTQTNGIEDYANVNKFQDGIKLIPLNQLQNKAYQASVGSVNSEINSNTPPPKQVEAMDAITFFQKFAELLKTNPPHGSDSKIIAEIKQMGLIPGEEFDASKLSANQLRILNIAKQSALKKIAAATQTGGQVVNGWLIRRSDIGTYGNNYLARAAVAMWALGANIPQDAIYPSVSTDNNNQQLNGKNRYAIHFDKKNLPPVNAFWSITMYDQQGYLVPNSLKRYAIGDRDKLQYNKDGSLDIYIQHDSPGKNKESNWLPAPTDAFNLLLRLYWPKEEIISGKWTPPVVKNYVKGSFS